MVDRRNPTGDPEVERQFREWNARLKREGLGVSSGKDPVARKLKSQGDRGDGMRRPARRNGASRGT